MADEYIRRETALEAQNKSMNLKECRIRLERLPAADVVLRSCYDSILAENDTMREMLAQIGKKPGDKMDDVREMVTCEECDWHVDCGYHYCNKLCQPCPDNAEFFCAYGERPKCGADMREGTK